MTLCEPMIVTIIGGIVSGIIATYIVRLIDNSHKNNRQGK